ncbi:hypothetical protein DER44DRAFT_900865 [Fusarium oxysporum]|nr:hypothetical protein DER44DRAFT_900865 [Fusarium oxysporum]
MSARQTRKRPASGSFQGQLAKRGRPTNTDRDSQVPHKAVSRETARTMLLAHPPLKVDLRDERRFYRELIETPADNWSAEDEAAVVADWNQSEAKSCTGYFSQRHDLLSTWRISLRLYQEAPVTLLSLFTSLRYQPVSTNGIASLRWTVICYLDDRRIWELNRTYGYPALKALLQNIKECGDSRIALSYHEMHEAAREAVSEQRATPSVLSDLLFTLWDLQVLLKAVNSTTFKAEWNYSVDEAFRSWDAERKGRNIPSKDKLPLLYELAHLDLLRHYVVLRRKHPRTSQSEGSRQDVVASERQIPGTTGAQRVICEGEAAIGIRDTPDYESSFNHRTPSQNEQDCDDMAIIGGGVDVDSDGSVAAPLNPNLSLPQGSIQPEITSTFMEDRPFRRERRYKALVDGEETEDEQEDLQRNQHHGDSSQRVVPDRQGTTLRLSFGDRTSQFDLQSAYRQPDAPKQKSPRRSSPPVPIVPHASAAASSQLTVPGEGSPKSRAEQVESRLKRIENQNTRILDLLQPQTQEHQPVAHLLDQRRGKTDNIGTAEMVQVIESVGVNDSDLVHDLRAQVAHLLEEKKELSDTVKEKDALIKELSDKVKYQKFDISDLHQEIGTKNTALEAEKKRADSLEAQLSELRW